MWRPSAIPVILLVVAGTIGSAQQRFEFNKKGAYRSISSPTATVDLQTLQGFNFRVWLGTNATVGERAFVDGIPPNRIGCEYPVNSNIEHLYGAGIWIGALVDTGTGSSTQRIAAVTTGYDWGAQGARNEMFGHQVVRDTFFHASILQPNGANRRGVDDDHDGKIDEDELDGYDNDGDWNPFVDDVGGDGVPDSLEIGCRGGYDPLKNPDPADDDYAPLVYDSCHPDPNTGGLLRKNDKEQRTEKNGIPDHGEPHVDEDYGAVSESDIYVGYKDLFQDPAVSGHIPLGLKVFQKSYAWRNYIKDPFIVLEYTITNIGTRTLDSVYIGFFVDPLVGPFLAPDLTQHKYVAYVPSVRTGYASNAFDKPSTPIGVTVLGTPGLLESLRYTFSWNRFEDNPGTDLEHYQRMSSGNIKPNQPLTSGLDTQFLFAFGPFESIHPGEILKISVALVTGDGIEVGESPLLANAGKALALFNSGYQLPVVPPSPPLRAERGDHRVRLNWQWHEGDPLFDPLETWDDSDKLVETLPMDNWRRRNPPEGKTRGGRVFEGFKLWRSETPDFTPGSFSLLKQFDIADELHFEFDTGLSYDFVDSNLIVGKTYWYSVTSFTIPRITYVSIPDTTGGPPRIDTVRTPYAESDAGGNAKKIQLPFIPSERLGEVKVVPNPYRSDLDYTFEQGGWEGLGRLWTENERVIWFTHLPARAVVRIFSLSGDIVATIRHDDLSRSASNRPEGQEEWHLLSDGGRAIASGVYVFTVESELGTQIGKFVVIR
ncbi:MAG TPA: hypothetical protein VL633_04460 [Bacteroidota bacterium]|nr:hypothetical protein [Bacteroidota bacterium]